jgi:mannose-6-phosphate isomerase-like protein (cupin superfamily)
MEYALQPDDRIDGRRFEVGAFTQRLADLDGDLGDHDADELVFVLSGTGNAVIAGDERALRPGISLSIPAGTSWTASGDARAISVLVHDPDPSDGPAVVDCDEVEKGTATAGRQFVLGAPCASATQFIGLIPAGRAPDHFHYYDEVIYVLEGEGYLDVSGEQAPIRPGTCIHLPKTLVHSLANTGKGDMRVLGVFRPAGSPAEAYYPDGTAAVVPTAGES